MAVMEMRSPKVIIMSSCRSPLPRDRQTEIQWGIEDFRARFGRAPEGLWLPETAVDTPTLESMADAGLTFVILAPGRHSPFEKSAQRLGSPSQPIRSQRVVLTGSICQAVDT